METTIRSDDRDSVPLTTWRDLVALHNLDMKETMRWYGLTEKDLDELVPDPLVGQN